MNERNWDDVLEPGVTCWKKQPASRARLLMGSDQYFRALRSACERACRTIIIIGWDFDRRERLGRDDDAPTLEAFFDGLVSRRDGLDVWLLSWDYTFVYAGEREWFQEQHLRKRTHSRFHACFDGAHPVGASQHQKLVVIDDRIAFCGGIDLSRWRWDSCEHLPDDPRRTDPDGERYPPFHDGMMLVEGPAAESLGELARTRWRDSGADEQPPPGEPQDASPWPDGVDGAWNDVELAIARTAPAFREQEGIREIERLYLASFTCARDYIYLENQYFTSRRLSEALAERLRAPEGPEVLLVLPRKTGGWLEQVTMDALRAYRVRSLIEADLHDRLRVFYPHIPGLDRGDCLGLHAKLMIADDRFLRIGSANTSNRSMGLDSECDLAVIDAPGEGARGVLHRLLAEHLDTSEEAVAEARAREGGLIPAVDRLRQGEGRSLRLLDVASETPALDLAAEEDLVDPDEPIDGAYLVRRAMPEESKSGGHLRLYLFGGFVLALLVLGAGWRWTPLGEWLTPERLSGWLELFEATWVRALTVLLVISLTTLVMVPLSALVVASALLLGPWLGFAVSMVGALVSGALAFLGGQLFGGQLLERYGESRVHRLSKRLSDRGVLAVAVLRLMPVAPYTVVNLVAGASHLTLGKFLLGSAIGLLPGVAALSWFSGSLFEAVQNPSTQSLGILAVVIVAIGVGVWLLRRLLRDA